jgi:hypothetical protein
VSHLAAERFRLSAGIDAQHIPFRGPNEAFTELLAGRIDFYFLPLAPALPLVKEGRLIALAVSTDTRAIALPDVPTTTELGLKDSAYLFWTGIFVPAKTPRAVIDKLYDENRKAMLVPSVQERLAKVGTEPMPMSMADFELLQSRRALDRQADAAGRHQAEGVTFTRSGNPLSARTSVTGRARCRARSQQGRRHQVVSPPDPRSSRRATRTGSRSRTAAATPGLLP